MHINHTRFIHGALLLASVFLTACGGGGGGGGATAPTLTSIAITPASATIVIASTANLIATGTYSNNSTTDITTSVTWTSAAPSTASVVSNTGVVTGVAAGATTVTATLSGITSNAASITVTASPLTGITVTPSLVSIDTGTTTTFTATGTYADLSTGNISGSVTWNSSNSAAATFSGFTATGVGVGSSSITATLSGVTSNTATLNVVAPTLTAIAITPGSSTIAKGLTANLTATGTYSSGPTANITNLVTWTSLAPTIASVGTTGVMTGVAVGTTTVTASLSGITSPAANITVTAATLTSIAVTPTAISIAKGTTTPFTAIGTYTDGPGDISSSVTWNSSDITKATFSGSTAKGAGVGSSNITASLSGVTSNTAVLTVTPAVVTAIAVTPSTPTVAVGSTTNLTATATYSDATTADITTSATWSSSGCASIASVASTTGVATGLGSGNCQIFATSTSGVSSPAITLTVYQTYTIGGTITGDPLASTNSIGPILQNNGGDNLFIPTIVPGIATPFTFNTPIADGASYSITQIARARAPSQDCRAGTPVTGNVAGGNVTVSITCVLSPIVPTFAYVTNSTAFPTGVADTVSAFTIAASGVLAASTTPTTASGDGPYAVVVDPTGQFAYVANSLADSISAYGINAASGALTALTDVDAGTAGTQASIPTGDNPVSIAVHPSGGFAYVANQGNGPGGGYSTGSTLSVYSINTTTGALTAIDADAVTTGTQASIATGLYPYAVSVDPFGKFAYVANYDGNTISAYTINQTSGALTPVGSPVAAGTGPSSVAIDPTGKCALVTNNTSDNVMSYTINSTSGALALISTVVGAGGSAPRSVSIDPNTGLYAYVANAGGNNVSAFSVNSSTCAIAAIDADATTGGPQTTIAAGTVPFSVNVDPSGQFVYVANFGSNDVSVYSIAGGSGALTLMQTLATGAGPTSVTTTQ